MRRFLSILSFFAALCILPAAFLAHRSLPVNTRELVEKKYAGWSGVLRAWVAADWSCESSFIHWLDKCASSFEKQHNGVYVEFVFAQAGDMNNLFAGDVLPPELIFFSPGLIQSGDGLIALPAQRSLRPGLQTDSRAVPVAAGGYICVSNADAETNAFVIPQDGDRRYSEAVSYIIEETPSQTPSPIEEPGLDLGLPALARSGYAVSESAFEDFIAGKTCRTLVTQKELARLIALNAAGRGPEWKCEISGTRALCDQLLLAAIPETEAGRETAAEAFIEHLLRPESQAALSSIGACGVTDAPVYSEFSSYAALEALLRTRILVVPAAFSDDSQNS